MDEQTKQSIQTEIQAILCQFKTKEAAIQFLRKAIEEPALRQDLMRWTGAVGYSQDCLEDLIFFINYPEFS